MILTQIEFGNGMTGRFGSGQKKDTTQQRWSEFFGDIELIRAEVPNEGTILYPDKPLPADAWRQR